jgi:hypothetical protein
MTIPKIIKAGLPNSKKLKKLLILALFLVLAGAISILGFFGYAIMDMPAFDPQQLYGANNTVLYDQDEQVFSSLACMQRKIVQM